MSTHRYTFESARRVAELIFRSQELSPRPLLLFPLAAEWGISWRSVRRLVDLALEVSGDHDRDGALQRTGRGKTAQLTWCRRTSIRRERGRGPEIVALLAAIGPWKAVGVPDVSDVLGQLLNQATRTVPRERARLFADLADRGFYYQPFLQRRMRDPDVLDEVLSALFWRAALRIDRYHSPRGLREALVIDPWTLADVNGLYLIAPRRGLPDRPRLWALHRMEGTRWLRGQSVKLPRNYHPEQYLGHGYGPFFGTEGEVTLRVPADEAPFVLEFPLPHQVGEAVPLEDGSYRVRLDVGWNIGLELWARWAGVTIESA
jgi:hypothetical protein